MVVNRWPVQNSNRIQPNDQTVPVIVELEPSLSAICDPGMSTEPSFVVRVLGNVSQSRIFHQSNPTPKEYTTTIILRFPIRGTVARGQIYIRNLGFVGEERTNNWLQDAKYCNRTLSVSNSIGPIFQTGNGYAFPCDVFFQRDFAPLHHTIGWKYLCLLINL